MIDLEALEWRIAENADKGIHVAPIVRELIAELRMRRAQVDGYRMTIDGLENAAHDERAAVVAWLLKRVENSYAVGTIPGTNGYEARMILEAIERGEHRRKEQR